MDIQDVYDEHLSSFLKQLPNEKYVFEVTKCCNYSTFVLVNKRGTLLDLYKEVSTWFECKTVKALYLLDDEEEHRTTIPMTDVVSIKDFISTAALQPIYPVPNWVVYRIYLDDGHSHTEECTTQK
jgi:hypothetical protein